MLWWRKMRRTKIYVPNPGPVVGPEIDQNEYDKVASSSEDTRSVSSESDLADSPAGQTIRSSYKSPIFVDPNSTPLEPCPVNGCPLNPHSGVLSLILHNSNTISGRGKNITFTFKFWLIYRGQFQSNFDTAQWLISYNFPVKIIQWSSQKMARKCSK